MEQEKFEASLRHYYKKAGEQEEAGNALLGKLRASVEEYYIGVEQLLVP